MTAKIDFSLRCEPAQGEMLIFRQAEGGFRKIVFGSNGLQYVILRPGFEQADSRRIALEKLVGESIDLVELEFAWSEYSLTSL